jgi:hypothetical protein
MGSMVLGDLSLEFLKPSVNVALPTWNRVLPHEVSTRLGTQLVLLVGKGGFPSKELELGTLKEMRLKN